MDIDLKAIAREINDSGKDPEEAIKEFFLNAQQESRVRQYLGKPLKKLPTQADMYARIEEDLARAIEQAKRRPQPKAQMVVIKGRLYWDITPLFIDCGVYGCE